MTNELPELGKRLSAARKERFPKDGVRGFAPRIGVSVSTLVKMEQGKLSVSLGNYHEAARVLGLENQFDLLFVIPKSLFDD
ncbi:helix-turn-helix domain-containing protein [Zhongshania marina]|uniref:XRE family transcriptional regulator n=1 Tax=Zhongshania marina TaxID=2304603 RepID=A0A2S4HKS2_9GAMM|nr:helix-turn-helix transcriptional regulator [Marortus luteolus]POP54281.1 XRE family transcriptional regulator [Marortus luteolus]